MGVPVTLLRKELRRRKRNLTPNDFTVKKSASNDLEEKCRVLIYRVIPNGV